MHRLLLLAVVGCAPANPGVSGAKDTGATDGSAGSGADGGDGTDVVGYQEGDLVESMDVDRLMSHLDALQAIADSQASNRAAGTLGYDESVLYVADQLEAAGYEVTFQVFPWLTWDELSDPVMETSDDVAWELGRDFDTLSYSAAGDVEGPLVAVDLMLPPGAENSSSSGCQRGDFDAFPPGAVALIQRGACTFNEKVAFAADAGAVGVIIFNEGQRDRSGVVEGVLDPENVPDIPVLGASFAAGEALAAAIDAGTVTAHIVVDTTMEDRPVANVWADLPGATDQLLVVGGHLDSVQDGPGINDNGSGTALILELALQAKETGFEPENTIRFALWGAEEAGLVGSFEYMDKLDGADLERHIANLNFDMVGSPNGGRFIYDGNGSAGMGGYPAPVGSDLIESFFTDFFDASGQIWGATAFDGRSDYGPFIYYGIPAGGLFSGAEENKSAAEASDWGGSASSPYDACYHRACDNIENIDEALFLDMARAAAHATEGIALLDSLGGPSAAPPNADTPDLPSHHIEQDARDDLGGCADRPSR